MVTAASKSNDIITIFTYFIINSYINSKRNNLYVREHFVDSIIFITSWSRNTDHIVSSIHWSAFKFFSCLWISRIFAEICLIPFNNWCRISVISIFDRFLNRWESSNFICTDSSSGISEDIICSFFSSCVSADFNSC